MSDHWRALIITVYRIAFPLTAHAVLCMLSCLQIGLQRGNFSRQKSTPQPAQLLKIQTTSRKKSESIEPELTVGITVLTPTEQWKTSVIFSPYKMRISGSEFRSRSSQNLTECSLSQGLTPLKQARFLRHCNPQRSFGCRQYLCSKGPPYYYCTVPRPITVKFQLHVYSH